MDYLVHENHYKTIKEMPEDERPRERIKNDGSCNLSDTELISVLLGSGVAGIPVQTIAQNIVSYLASNDGNDVSIEELTKIKGVGMAQACIISAAVELGRRMQKPIKIRYRNTKAIYDNIRHYGDRDQEHFICIMFNGALEILGTKVVTIGLIDRSLVHPREVFSEPIKAKASAIVIAHNHPSGNLHPSPDDLGVTQAIINAGKVLGIQVMDHLIFSETGFYSMNEHGDVWFN